MESSSSRAHSEQHERVREQFQSEVAAEEDDPLQPYERYVNWLIEQEQQNAHAFDLEIITVLEEAVRKLKEGPEYKGDVRYLKLWLAYAKHVEKPDIIYVFLLKNNIGTIHAQLYEDYAVSLEHQNRLREAEESYRLGIARSTRAVERLKKRYHEFQQRVASKNTLKITREPPHIAPGESSSAGARLYRNPLRNIASKRTSASSAPAAGSSAKAETSDPYAYIKAASNTVAGPGKRTEKFRFDMSLLFKDGQEYCIQEARAKSLGLLGKKWGPPPASEPGPHQPPTVKAHIEFNDDANRPPTRTNQLRMNMNLTASLANEPTVTINTKEALKDVFGMYNSPEKSVKMVNVALGSKHAPVKKLEPLFGRQSRSTLKKITELNDDESEQRPAKGTAFRPFVDDDNKKENVTPAPPKFKPFVDENTGSRTPHITPGPRKGLALREIPAVTPVSKQKGRQEDDSLSNDLEKPVTQETQSRSVFSRVFTPVSQAEKSRPALHPTGLRDPQQRSNGQRGSLLGSKVFSRPPEAEPKAETQTRDGLGLKSSAGPLSSSVSAQPSNQSQSQSQSQPVFRRSTSAPQRLAFTPVSRERQPLAFAPQRPSPQPVEPEPEIEDENEEEEEDEEEFELSLVDENGEEPQEYYDDDEPYTAPMGGRFGQFAVMTPIAERTFECTMSTRAFGTPSDRSGPILDTGILHRDQDAAAAAVKLAKELREEEQEKAKGMDVDVEDIIDVEDEGSSSRSEEEELLERTGTLSLADAISVASSFKPANPCNPSDPHIVNTLLSLIPPEPEFHDLRAESSNRLDSLQKFASRCASRRSGRRSPSTASDGDDSLRVQLHERHFNVTGKLGEGGFGVVFKVKAVRAGSQSDDEDMDSDDEEDGDDANHFALKVVKPRSIWEYHILRRIHNMLPAPCRSSIVRPHALYAYRDESFLVLDLCNQGTLLDVVNHAGEAGVSQQGACLDELLVMFFAIELLKFILNMHATGFIHGDFKIDNCLLRLEEVPGGSNAWSGMYQPTGEGGWRHKGIKMIDFGRTIDTRMYPAGQTFVADWATDAYDCLEMRENRPWTFETDYYGLAGIVYCLLFGKYFDADTVVPVPSANPVRYKIASQFKRYWQAGLWTQLFDILLNPKLVRPDGSLPLVPELSALREEMETWLSSNCNRSSNTLKGLLKKVERSVLSGR